MSGSGETVGASKNDKVTTPTPDQGEKGKEKCRKQKGKSDPQEYRTISATPGAQRF